MNDSDPTNSDSISRSDSDSSSRSDAVAHSGFEHESVQDIRAERIMLDRAIGGWRGLFDSGAPTLVFVIVYLIQPDNLQIALLAALTVGVTIAVLRVIRKDSLQQVFAGLVGVGIAAGFSAWTGRAENFFLPGLLTNAAYGTAFLISILVRWPLFGVFLGLFSGTGTKWRGVTQYRRAAAAATWIWAGMFFFRLAVQLPLYVTGAIGALGVMKVVMGLPLFLASAYFTFRLLQPIYNKLEEEKSQE
jgi:hypothetical protein